MTAWIALLACGLNSTVTATLAGQAVMEGFLDIRLAPWLGKLVTAPDKPYVAVLGGAKVSDKIAVVDALLEQVETDARGYGPTRPHGPAGRQSVRARNAGGWAHRWSPQGCSCCRC